MGLRVGTAKWYPKYNRWQINVQKDGKRRSFTDSTPGRNGQRACNAKADVWLDDGLTSPEIKAQKLFDKWLEELKSNTGTGHWKNYEGYWNVWIGPAIGRMKIGQVTEQHLQDIINAANKKGLAHKSLKNILSCMTAYIKFCRKNKATTLVVENVYIPKNAPVGERTILQPHDIARLFEFDETLYRGKPTFDHMINAYRFEVVTGLRPGEVRGLMWDDIQDDKISMKRSINTHNETTKGKNNNAQRTFGLTKVAKKIIADQREWMFSVGLRSQYIFPDLDGEPMTQSGYYKRWVRYREHAGLAKVHTYELRHTFVSLIKQLPEAMVKDLVGHSVDMDTFGVYGHEVDGEMQLAASLVQEQLERYIKGQSRVSGL